MQLITIKESHYASDLAVLKSRLESEGIECFLTGELTSQVLNHIPSMSAKLQVDETNLPRVKQILKETGEWNPDEINIICPKCGSEDVSVKQSLANWLKMIPAFFVAVVSLVPFGKGVKPVTFRCRKCSFEFQK